MVSRIVVFSKAIMERHKVVRIRHLKKGETLTLIFRGGQFIPLEIQFFLYKKVILLKFDVELKVNYKAAYKFHL